MLSKTISLLLLLLAKKKKRRRKKSPFLLNQAGRRQGCMSVCEWLMPPQHKQTGVTQKQCGQQSS